METRDGCGFIYTRLPIPYGVVGELFLSVKQRQHSNTLYCKCFNENDKVKSIHTSGNQYVMNVRIT